MKDQTTGVLYAPQPAGAISVKALKKAKVTLSVGGKKESYFVEYDSLESLCKSVFDLICQKRTQLDKTVLTLYDGTSYLWNEVMAHYCFAKNRISETEFVEYQFAEENRL